MSEGKIQLVGLSFEELEQWTLGQKQPRFRAKQLYGWLMKGAAFSEMTNLPAAFREVLEREALANPVRIERCVKSKLDGTEKFLYALEDGNLIEGVLMRYHHGNTLCLLRQHLKRLCAQPDQRGNAGPGVVRQQAFERDRARGKGGQYCAHGQRGAAG